MNERRVRGSFGTIEYSGYSNEIIEIPLEFEDPVMITSRTVFDIKKLSGDDVYDSDYGVVQIGDSGKKHRIQIVVPEGRQGSFKLELKYDIYDPQGQGITGIVEPIIVEYETSSVHERVDRLEKLVLILLQSRSSGNYHDKSGEEMLRDAMPVSVEWMSKLLREYESGEKTIEEYCVVLEERLNLNNED